MEDMRKKKRAQEERPSKKNETDGFKEILLNAYVGPRLRIDESQPHFCKTSKRPGVFSLCCDEAEGHCGGDGCPCR